jgi:hypothetical protein
MPAGSISGCSAGKNEARDLVLQLDPVVDLLQPDPAISRLHDLHGRALEGEEEAHTGDRRDRRSDTQPELSS